MNIFEVGFVASFTLAGTFSLVVARTAVRTTRHMQDAVLKAAKGLYKEALEQEEQDNEVLLKLHNQMIELAAIAPAIAAGIIETTEERVIMDSELVELQEFLHRSGWAIGYVMVGIGALKRLEFHAKPWDIKRIKSAIFYSVLMSKATTKDGGLRLSYTDRNDQRRVNDFVNLDTKADALFGGDLIGAH